MEIGEYVRTVVGCESAPDRALDWLRIPEEWLFEITHRPVFCDATGDVSRRFEAFALYPEDVWRKRLAACLAWMWEWGVKQLGRSQRREDWVTASAHWTRFSDYAMKVGFLLNRQYAPYHKWLYREFLRLPHLADLVAPLLEAGIDQRQTRTELVAGITSAYTEHLQSLGYVAAPRTETTAYPDHVLNAFARSVRDSIRSDEIRGIKLYVEALTPPFRATRTWVLPPD